jgi:hypothetical protein
VRNKHFGSKDEEIGRWRGGMTIETVIYVVLLVLGVSGAVVNVLVILGIKLNRRWLFLPWLVFHLMAIMGEFLSSFFLSFFLSYFFFFLV